MPTHSTVQLHADGHRGRLSEEDTERILNGTELRGRVSMQLNEAEVIENATTQLMLFWESFHNIRNAAKREGGEQSWSREEMGQHSHL